MVKKYQILFITLLRNCVLLAQLNSDTVTFNFSSELRIRNGALSVQLIKSDTVVKVYYKLLDNPTFFKVTEETKARAKAEYEKHGTEFYRKILDSIMCFRGSQNNYTYKIDSLDVSLSTYNKIKQQLKFVIKPYTKENLLPEGAADGSFWDLKFWDDGKYYTYRAWSPNGKDQKRNLQNYVNVSHLIVSLTKLNSKKILE